MVKGISAVDAIYGSTKKTTLKNVVKKVVDEIREHDAEILSAGVVVGGTALYGAALHHYIADDKVEITPAAESEIENKQNFFQKLGEKIKDKLSLDFNNPPAGIDPTEPYMMDKTGHYIMDEYGAIPNPWYNPDAINHSINAVTSVEWNPVTMDSFLQHALAKGSDAADNIADIAGMSFSGDMTDIDDNVLETALKGIKSILENIADFT